jgi:hypothetical protein
MSIAHLQQHVQDVPNSKLSKLQQGYAEILSRYEWDVFGTHTWARPSSPEVMLRNFKWWLFTVQVLFARSVGLAWLDGDRDRVQGPWANAYRKGRGHPKWVFAIEPFRNGGLHAHSLVRWSDRLRLPSGSRDDLRPVWKVWKDNYGRGSFDRPQAQGCVTTYCSKYVVKGGDIELSPSFSASRLPAG